MKHYVLGLIFNKSEDKILLIEKQRPEWMAGCWNGIGGKIEEGETHEVAMLREVVEETQINWDYNSPYTHQHVITFVCPGGTVFVYKIKVTTNYIAYRQTEDECLRVYCLNDLPDRMMSNLKWIIPLSLSSVQFPVIIQQNALGV